MEVTVNCIPLMIVMSLCSYSRLPISQIYQELLQLQSCALGTISVVELWETSYLKSDFYKNFPVIEINRCVRHIRNLLVSAMSTYNYGLLLKPTHYQVYPNVNIVSNEK